MSWAFPISWDDPLFRYLVSANRDRRDSQRRPNQFFAGDLHGYPHMYAFDDDMADDGAQRGAGPSSRSIERSEDRPVFMEPDHPHHHHHHHRSHRPHPQPQHSHGPQRSAQHGQGTHRAPNHPHDADHLRRATESQTPPASGGGTFHVHPQGGRREHSRSAQNSPTRRNFGEHPGRFAVGEEGTPIFYPFMSQMPYHPEDDDMMFPSSDDVSREADGTSAADVRQHPQPRQTEPTPWNVETLLGDALHQFPVYPRSARLRPRPGFSAHQQRAQQRQPSAVPREHVHAGKRHPAPHAPEEQSPVPEKRRQRGHRERVLGYTDEQLNEAAQKIQAVYRGHHIRSEKLLTQLAKLNEIRDRYHHLVEEFEPVDEVPTEQICGYNELLSKILVELDAVDSHGDEVVRAHRKGMVKDVSERLDALGVYISERKASDRALDELQKASAENEASKGQVAVAMRRMEQQQQDTDSDSSSVDAVMSKPALEKADYFLKPAAKPPVKRRGSLKGATSPSRERKVHFGGEGAKEIRPEADISDDLRLPSEQEDVVMIDDLQSTDLSDVDRFRRAAFPVQPTSIHGRGQNPPPAIPAGCSAAHENDVESDTDDENWGIYVHDDDLDLGKLCFPDAGTNGSHT